MAPHQYWMFDWLEEYGDVGSEKIQKLLADSTTAVKRLKEQAIEAESGIWTPPTDENNLVASVGLDLTGDLGCSDPECRSHEVDELFSKAWHYFDKIIVADSVSHMLARHWEIDDQEHWIEPVADQLEVLNYIRNIGAADLVHFSKKPSGQIEYWDESKQTDLREYVAKRSTSLRQSIIDEARIDYDDHGDHWIGWWINHPTLGHVQHAVTAVDDPTDHTPNREQVVDSLLARHAGYLMADLAMSERASAPLGTTSTVHHELLLESENIEHGTVAFNLELPILDGIPTVDLLKLRKDEHDAFEDFRTSLKTAIQDRLDNSNASDPQSVAQEIEDDVIAPQLRSINRRMTAAANSLKRKSLAMLGVGALATTVGLVSGFGPAALLGIGVGAVMDTGPVKTYYDKKEAIELHDMYFLWRATHL